MAILQKRNGNRLSRFFSVSDVKIPSERDKIEERRAVSHNPQSLSALPDRTLALSTQQPARSSSAQIAHNKLLPLAPPAEIHRRQVGGSESSTSLRVSSAATSPVGSRPPSGHSSQPSSPYGKGYTPQSSLRVPGVALPAATSPDKAVNKRKSWFGGSGTKLSKPGKGEVKDDKPEAWIVGIEGQRPPYDVAPLLNAQQVPELWSATGNTYIYLFPRTSGHGPSFCVDSSIFSSSSVLTQLAFGNLYSVASGTMSSASLAQASRRQRSIDLTGRIASRTTSPAAVHRSAANSASDPSEGHTDLHDLEATNSNSGPVHLYLPISLSADGAVTTAAGQGRPQLTNNDVDTLISVRNLFAFLLGQSIVATERVPSVFRIFLKISDLLSSFNFSNLDGSTHGEIAYGSFSSYVEELKIGDVRSSREKTLEAIVLGERMRSVTLYNEAFVHGVGKWEDLHELQSPKFDLISHATKMRMERAALDLDQRKRNITQKLKEFEFPGMWAGIVNSKTADESKTVRFGVWRESFMNMRKWFMSYYRHKYGAWPPKASSKKNNLETSGLNRLVLKDISQDLSDLYDLLVDRTNLTTRTTDIVMDDDDTEISWGPMHMALRKVLNEYDRSTPPVQPPIPFDTPRIPAVPLTGEPKADKKAGDKKLKKDVLMTNLGLSYNQDAAANKSPFLAAFKEFEYNGARNCTIGHVADLRQGQWLFIYAVLQSLPMLVVDAPAVKWTSGVEYFLCMPPRSGVPWASNAERERTYYAIQGNANAVVSLPSDIIEFGIEGIYRRSHCWVMAERWTQSSEIMNQAVKETLKRDHVDGEEDMVYPPLERPVMMSAFADTDSAPGSRSSSRGRDPTNKRRSVMLSGLEALPMPPGVFANQMGAGVGVRTPPGSSHGSPTLGPRGSPSVRPVSSQADGSKTFDAIFASMDTGREEKGKKGKKK